MSNEGTLEFGTPDSSVGGITVGCNFSNSGTIIMDIGGYGANGDPIQDGLGIAGNATLGGTIDVELLDGYTPQPGDSYQLITYHSRVGATGASLPPGDWDQDFSGDDSHSGGFRIWIEHSS